MATIVRRRGRQGPRYQVRIRLRSGQASATFASLSKARAWAAMAEGSMRGSLGQAPRAVCVSSLLERYRREVLLRKPPGTRVNYQTHLAWWRAHVGHVRLFDLTPAHLVRCREILATTRSATTVNRYLATLSHAFTVAVREWEWLPANPLHRIGRLREPQGRVRFLSGEERRRLLEACERSHHPLLLPVVIVALSTGARKMELLGLTWPDVGLHRGRLHLEETKKRERRAMPLTGRALAVMQSLGKIRRIDTALVFPRADGTAPVDLRYAWKMALQEAGIMDFRFHDLRHSCASYLAMNGASLVEIAEVLGHKTLAMVKRYAHLTEGHTAAVVARMNAAVFPDMAGCG